LSAPRILSEIAGKIAPGIPPAYTEAHVLMALETIGSGLGVGRQKLSKNLRLGEGTIRTLVKRLKTMGLIVTSRIGMNLSEKGTTILEELGELILACHFPPIPITVGSVNHAVLVKGVSTKVKAGIEQRDAAIIAGASGATTLVFDEHGLRMPGMKDPIEESVRDLIMEKLGPSSGDAIIIGSSDNSFLAEIAAKYAALVLLKC